MQMDCTNCNELNWSVILSIFRMTFKREGSIKPKVRKTAAKIIKTNGFMFVTLDELIKHGLPFYFPSLEMPHLNCGMWAESTFHLHLIWFCNLSLWRRSLFCWCSMTSIFKLYLLLKKKHTKNVKFLILSSMLLVWFRSNVSAVCRNGVITHFWGLPEPLRALAGSPPPSPHHSAWLPAGP